MGEPKSDEQWARAMLRSLTRQQWTALREVVTKSLSDDHPAKVVAEAYRALSELGDIADSLAAACPHIPEGLNTMPALEWIRDHFVPAYTARDEALWTVWEAIGRTERAHINPCVWWACIGDEEEKIADAVRAALRVALENGRREAMDAAAAPHPHRESAEKLLEKAVLLGQLHEELIGHQRDLLNCYRTKARPRKATLEGIARCELELGQSGATVEGGSHG